MLGTLGARRHHDPIVLGGWPLERAAVGGDQRVAHDAPIDERLAHKGGPLTSVVADRVRAPCCRQAVHLGGLIEAEGLGKRHAVECIVKRAVEARPLGGAHVLLPVADATLAQQDRRHATRRLHRIEAGRPHHRLLLRRAERHAKEGRYAFDLRGQAADHVLVVHDQYAPRREQPSDELILLLDDIKCGSVRIGAVGMDEAF